MAKRPNGSRRGSYSYIPALAISAAIFASAALPASLLSKAATLGARVSNANGTGKGAEGNMPPLDDATAWINTQHWGLIGLAKQSSGYSSPVECR